MKQFIIIYLLSMLSLMSLAQNKTDNLDFHCASSFIDSTDFVNLPWYRNNIRILNFIDSLDQIYSSSQPKFNYSGGFDNRAYFKVPVKAWIYNDDNGTGGVDYDQVEASIELLNDIFNGRYNPNGMSSGHLNIQFYLACDPTIINNSYYAHNPNEAVSNYMLNNLQEPGHFNIHYIQTHNVYGGLGKFPWKSGPYACILVTNHGNHLNPVIAHEVGHSLGLLHTHQGRRGGDNGDENRKCYQEVQSRSKKQEVYCIKTMGNKKCAENGDAICDTEGDPNIHGKIDFLGNNQYEYKKDEKDLYDNIWTPDIYNIMSYTLSNIRQRFSRTQHGIMLWYTLDPMRRKLLPLHIANDFVDIYEPDNTQATADNIVLNETQLRGLHASPKGRRYNAQFEYCDQDMVRLIVPHDMVVNIETSSFNSSEDIDTKIELFDNTGNILIAQNDDKSAQNKYSLISETLSGGTYFVRIANEGNSAGKYLLQASRCRETCCASTIMNAATNITNQTGDFTLGAIVTEMDDYFGHNIEVSDALFNIQTNNRLGFNSNDYPVFDSRYNLTICNNANIKLLPKGQLNVGDSDFPETRVNFNAGTKLTISNKAVLKINQNAVVSINSGASLECFGGRIIVSPEGLLEIEGNLNFSSNNEPLEISGGGKVVIKGDNNFNLHNSNGLIISDAQTTVIFEGNASLQYHPNANLTLNNGSVLEIRSELNVAPNATFTFGHDAGQDNGTLRLAANVFDELIYAGEGSRFVLPPNVGSTPVLEIAKHTNLSRDDVNGTYFEEVIIDQTLVKLNDSQRFRILAPKVEITNSNFIGGGSIHVHHVDNEPLSNDHYALATNCTFDATNLGDGGIGYWGAGKELQVNTCNFENEAGIYQYSNSNMEVNNCTFTESSFIFSNGRITVNNSYFEGAPGARINKAISLMKNGYGIIKNNTITNYDIGVYSKYSIPFSLTCNQFYTNTTGLHVGIKSGANMGPGTTGYNQITDNSTTNINWNYIDYCDLNNGGNELHNQESAYIITGSRIVESICSRNSPEYDCFRNQWSAASVSTRPYQIPHKFNVTRFDPINCWHCDSSSIRDFFPRKHDGCGTEINPTDVDGTVGKQGQLIIDATYGEADKWMDCPTCPIIYTKDFAGVHLSRAAEFASKHSYLLGGTDDEAALDLMHQILTYDYQNKTKEVYYVLNRVYSYAKGTSYKLLGENKQSLVKQKMKEIYREFVPGDFQDILPSETLFYMIDQADYKKFIGQFNEALDLYDDIAANTTDQVQEIVSKNAWELRLTLDYLNGELPWWTLMDSVINSDMTGGTGAGSGLGSSGCRFEKQAENNGNQEHTWNISHTKQAVGNAINMDGNGVEEFNFSPNPASKTIQLQVPSTPGIKTIRIVGVSGNVVLETNNFSTEVDLTNLESGIYFVQYFENKQLMTSKKLMLIE